MGSLYDGVVQTRAPACIGLPPVTTIAKVIFLVLEIETLLQFLIDERMVESLGGQ